jgi:antitoxin HicB
MQMTIQTFVYRAKFEPGERRGIVVSFPDVPEAITQGRNAADALTQAEDALGLALLSYPERGLALPKPKARGAKLVPVAIAPEVAAKLALLDALRERGLSKSAFARLIDKDEKEVRRILDPYHATKMSTLDSALRALNRRVVVAVQEMHV